MRRWSSLQPALKCCWPMVFVGMVLSARIPAAHAFDTSPPPILQWFESSNRTIENRMPDLFQAGYGAVWTPPPFRSDTSDFSVGYDVYDRFDLGSPGRPTLYGTESGAKQMASTLHRAGLDWHPDFVMNHNGYSTLGLSGFYEAGGYPGLAITLPNDVDGDFHGAYWGGPEYERLAGLIDVALEKNHQFIRSPVNPNDSRNIRAGTQAQFGRLANVPDPNNARFYPDIGHDTKYLFDPVTGESNIPVHSFNLENPLAGDATPENAMGYMMRNAQWLIQVIGADGLRIDAAKHVQGFTLDYLDRAVYRANPRPLLDGSTKHVFSYSEVYDANPAVLLPHVKKNINPNDIGRIGGNRDTLDFKLYFALKENLESTGTANAWQNIKNASLDVSDDGLHNGSAGVTFIQSHDVYKPYALADVAQAYTLMLPGNTVVYFNGKEFGDNREFPKDGRGDALSVKQGSTTTRLLDVRESHGRGNYVERWGGDDGLFSYERESSAIVLLSNRGDAGFDSRTLTQVGFAPGTFLIELTGNAQDPVVNPERTDQFGNHFKDIPEVVQVFNDNGVNKVNVRFQRPGTISNSGNFDFHGKGFLIYGLPTPQSTGGLELSNVSQTLFGDSTPNNNYENGTQRQSDVHVVTTDSFNARVLTNEVRLLGSDALRDVWADGDYAAIKVDGGVDVNGNGQVDIRTPGSVLYGFENFTTKNSPLIGRFGVNQPHGDLNAPRGDGEFIQTINTTGLAEGYHFLEVRAFRLRTDGGPEVFTSWKQSIYLDRLDPVSGVDSFHPFGGAGDNDVWIRSLDMTASDVNVFLNLPANISDATIKAMADGGQGHLNPIDRDLFKTGFFGIPNGNNVFTVVTYEITGNYNIQRITGQLPGSSRGGGFGDLNFDGLRNPDDIANSAYGFEHFLYSQNNEFNPAGDITGDGKIDTWDLLGLDEALIAGTAPQSSLDEWAGVMFRRVNFFNDGVLDSLDLSILRSNFGLTSGPNLWTYDLNVDGIVNDLDAALMIGAFGVVPEPTCATLALLGVIAVSRFRSRRKVA